MKIFPPSQASGEQGFAMLQVMVAVGILGILVTVFSGLVSQTVAAQKLARIHGEKLSLQTVFRGSLTCQTSCNDLKRDVPSQVGMWKIKPVCSAKKLVLNVAHPELYNGKFSRLYKQGYENSVCKTVAQIGSAVSPVRDRRRRFCDRGQKVFYVNFANQTIGCN